MKLALAFDSFKGSLTSQEVADAFSEGVKSVMPDCEFLKFDISDGGEGMLKSFQAKSGYEYVECSAHDPLMRPITARYLFNKKERSATIEMAEACGLTLLKVEERNPLRTTSFGLGEIILDGYRRGARKFVIGIGGSATNDAGMGMLQALGVRLYDSDHNEIVLANGESIARIHSIDFSNIKIELNDSLFEVACDVDNPLYGESGAAYIFAPQKGADREMVEQLDDGLRTICSVAKHLIGVDYSNEKGAGAAGGVGWAFLTFLKGRLCSGIELIIKELNLEKEVIGCDYIFTGEGRIDIQTLHGKAPMGILEVGRKLSIPVIAVGGRVDLTIEEIVQSGFEAIYEVTPRNVPLSKALSKERAKEYVKRCGAKLLEGEGKIEEGVI
jgi:glycerate kinase